MTTDKIEALLGNSEELAMELESLAEDLLNAIAAQNHPEGWEDTEEGQDALEAIDALQNAYEEVRIARDAAESALIQANR